MSVRDECRRLLPDVLDLAGQAGDAILEIYNGVEGAFEVEQKDDRTPLTEADMAAHEVIVEGLRRLTSEVPILSEESAEIPYSERAGWRRYWLVDPLDGTREFIKRNGEFTVNIALIEDGVPVMGVVFAPVLDTFYYGIRQDGAWKQQRGAEAERIHVQRLGAGPVRVAGSRSHADERLAAYLDRLGEHELRPMGSSLKSCLVAEGAADLYPRIGPTSEWDTAAAQAVVEAAGGHVTDTDLQPLRYNQKESLLNPDFLVFGDDSRDWSAYL
ncbi:MAG: 3'(2'),5'-bisphosphate nucleotidase CysQ [Halofilum sp. (in: g-proteobacteria)]|nr:3'(2'),5'-bisphosphate nucleotidase CysQ [Halofilum sp. (in: g-proteobacteria)]